MTIRTCVGPSRQDWSRMREELVTTLSGRGVLHCAGVTSALLDTAEAVVAHQRRAGQDVADEADGPGAP